MYQVKKYVYTKNTLSSSSNLNKAIVAIQHVNLGKAQSFG